MVQASQQTGIVVINQLQPIAVTFTAPEEQVGEINALMKTGDAKVEVKIDRRQAACRAACWRWSTTTIDSTTGTVKLKARFDNDGQQAVAGPRGDRRPDARRRQAGGRRAHGGGAARRRRAVRLRDRRRRQGRSRVRSRSRTRTTQEAAIASGLKDGEKIVTAGQSLLQAGRAGRRPNRAAAELSMSGGFSELFIRRPVATTLLMLALLLVGVVAYPQLPVAPLPQIDFPTIAVSAQLPGASPETMASSVAQPLERQFAQIAGVSQMTSTSSLGVERDHDAVRPRPQHRRRRQRRAGGDQRRRRAIAEEPAEPADLSQDQPVRHADPDSLRHLRRRAAGRSRRRRREHSRPAHEPDLRRVAGPRRRPAAEVDPRPDRPGQARREEPAARGRAHRRS